MSLALVGALLCLAGAYAALVPQSQQMNDLVYTIANAPPGQEVKQYRGQYFDILSPVIKYRYSEVFWVMQDAVPLPAELIARYNNSVMAVTGYEFDVLRKNASGDFEPVPCYQHYNHHYIVYMRGRDSEMQPMKVTPMSAHMPAGTTWEVPVGLKGNADSDIPAVTYFSEGNGNEGRKSYHGYPRNYAQLIASPVSVITNPMMINTHSPDGSRTGGPLPASSQAPPNASYSGLIECPCTTRIVRGAPQYSAKTQQTCSKSIVRPDTCFAAAQTLSADIRVASNNTVYSPKLPSGCSLTLHNGTAVVSYNTLLNSSVLCGAGSSPASLAVGHTQSLVDLHLSLDGTRGLATITMTGPADVWFAVGFGATVMANLPYTIVVDGTGRVEERHLGDHLPGTVLPPTLRVLSSAVAGGRRTVVLQRALVGNSSLYYSFSVNTESIPFINALGASGVFGYHANRTAAQIALFIDDVPNCVCVSSAGTINNIPYGENCRGEVLSQENSACFFETFNGGLPCCYHLQSLLDADQAIPPAYDEIYMKFRFYYEDYIPDTTHNLFRIFWMTETWQGEYDVPRADPSVPPEETIHVLTSQFKFGEMMYGGMSGGWNCSFRTDVNCADPTRVTEKGVNIIYAGGHCHAPACISLELYNLDTGQLVCRNTAVYGTTDEIYDEVGFMYVPPCVWGTPEEGLQPPPVFHLETNMLSIARTNSTYKHYGVMGFWQMRGAYVV